MALGALAFNGDGKYFTTPTKNPLMSKIYFPSFKDVATEDVLSLVYYERNGNIYVPRMHWCFVGEITGEAKLFGRQHVMLKDRNGYETRAVFYPEDGVFNTADIKAGHCFLINAGEKRHFLDGSWGFRVEHLNWVRVVKLSFVDLLAASDKYFQNKKDVCWECQAKKEDGSCLSRCGRCGIARYCGKECQMKDWKVGKHKIWCRELPKVRKLVDFDYRIRDTPPAHIVDLSY